MRTVLVDSALLAGVACFGFGLWLVHPACAWMFVGGVVMWGVYRTQRR